MHRAKTYVTMLCSVALTLSLLCSGGKLVVNTSDDINSNNTAVTPSLTELDLIYEVTTDDRCSNKNVNAIKTTTRENFFFLARRPKVIEKRKMNMMDCLHNVMDRNLTKNPDDFNENFLTYNFPASSSCFDYQQTIAAQIKVNYDFVKLKVGEVDNIEIFAVLPNKFTDIVLIENFLHENIARTMQLFKGENPDYSHLISKASEYAITGHRIRHVHRLKSSVVNLHEICKNLILQNNRFTIKGPATLLYLLSQYMRCYAKSMLPNYIKEALDEIERMNSIWFDFDIRQRTNDMGQNVTIFVETKANALLYDLDLADLYKVVSLYVNDKYMDRKTLFDKVITENSKLMPQRNCEEYGNTQNSTVTQPASIQVVIGTDDIDD